MKQGCRRAGRGGPGFSSPPPPQVPHLSHCPACSVAGRGGGLPVLTSALGLPYPPQPQQPAAEYRLSAGRQQCSFSRPALWVQGHRSCMSSIHAEPHRAPPGPEPQRASPGLSPCLLLGFPVARRPVPGVGHRRASDHKAANRSRGWGVSSPTPSQMPMVCLPCRGQPCTPNLAIPGSMKLQIPLPPLNVGATDGLCSSGQATLPLWAWYLLLKWR